MAEGIMPIERADRVLLLNQAPIALSVLSGWPILALHYRLAQTSASDRQQVALLAQVVAALTSDLAQHAVAHNVLVCERGTSVYVLPRKPQHGAAGEGAFNAALLETCGIAIVHTREHYETLTAQIYRDLLAEVPCRIRYYLKLMPHPIRCLSRLKSFPKSGNGQSSCCSLRVQSNEM